MKRALPKNLSAMSDVFWSQQADADETATFNTSKQSAGAVDAPMPVRRAVDGAVTIDKWQPVMSNSTITLTGSQVFRIDWAGLLRTEGSFYTLWYRSADRSDRSPHCLTLEDNFFNAEPISSMLYDNDGCRVMRRMDGTHGTNATGVEHHEQPLEWDSTDTCKPSPPCVPFGAPGTSDFVFSPFVLPRPRQSFDAPWSGFNETCSSSEGREKKLLVFAVACSGNQTDPSCDFLHPSRALLLSIDCSGEHQVLVLQNETVSLSSESCILNAILQPSGFLCKDREGTESPWATQPWAPVMDEYDSNALTVSAPEGFISGLTPCYHEDRFVVLVEACMSTDCTPSIASDDIFEFTFEHPSKRRASECLSKPKLAFVSAGRAAAAAVGGGISASLGSSVGGSISGSTAGSAGGAMALIGVVQFIAMLADNCGAQADSALQDFLTLLTPLQTFNLRIPMPDFPLFNPFKEWSVAVGISFCGMGGVDLVQQARADEGELFTANAVIGLVVLITVSLMHVLLLLPPFPNYRQVMHHSAPFGKWEAMLLLTAYQGLLISSFRMISMNEPVCNYAGFIILVIPTLTILLVTYVLARYVRPSSSERLVRWDEDEGKWVSQSKAPVFEHLARERSSNRLDRRASRHSRNSIVFELARVATRALPMHASRPDVGIPAPASPPMSMSMRLSQNVKESLVADFLDRYAHLFDAYLNVRGAWLSVPLMLVQQYVMAAFLGLAVASGGCRFEQVRVISSLQELCVIL
jgi:hypothetical protein